MIGTNGDPFTDVDGFAWESAPTTARLGEV